MEFPTIDDFLPKSLFFDGTVFAFNRIDLVRILMVSFVAIFFTVVASKSLKRAKSGNLVPTKPQSIVELLFEFIRNFTFETLGEKHGKKWLPLVTTIFCSVLFLNITGIIPGLNIAATASIGIPLIFGLWVFTAYWREGIASHGRGIKGFLVFVRSELFPPGLPIFVYPIYGLIELLQLLIIRPASLAIRLFANMMAGHMLLAICFVATQFFIFAADGPMKALGALTFVGAIVMVCFEILVAGLQAYIFSFLAVSYLEISLGHSEEAH